MKPNKDRGLDETEYLLRSPENARRLLEAVAWSVAMENEPIPKKSVAESIAELRRSVGLDLPSVAKG
jgi:hypothetical protein